MHACQRMWISASSSSLNSCPSTAIDSENQPLHGSTTLENICKQHETCAKWLLTLNERGSVSDYGSLGNVEEKYKRFLIYHNTMKWEATDPRSVFQNMPVVINGVRCGDTEAVASGLESISQSIQDMTEALKLLHGKNQNKNKHSDSSAFEAITTTLTDAFFVKRTWILKSSTASWESFCPGIKLSDFFPFFQWLSSCLYSEWWHASLCPCKGGKTTPVCQRASSTRGCKWNQWSIQAGARRRAACCTASMHCWASNMKPRAVSEEFLVAF